MTTFFVGTYPPDGLGTPVDVGEGIWYVTIGDGGELTAGQITTEAAPSFVVAHQGQPLLYAVEESDPSSLAVWDVAASPREVARVDLGGAHACHALLAADGATMYVSHYGTGDLSVVALALDGRPPASLATQTITHDGSGPRADRQEGSHAHSAAIAPGGRHLVVADLGTDELRRYTIGADGLLYEPGIAATLPPGSGPRHLVVRGELLYVVCELDHRLRTLRWDRESGTAEVIADQPTTLAPQRTGDDLYDAHIDLVQGERGDVVLVSVRGADVISVFDVAPEGELTYRAAFDAGHWPRHFAVVGNQLVVGAERGHEVRAYSLAEVVALPPESESGAVATLPYVSVDSPQPCVHRPLLGRHAPHTSARRSLGRSTGTPRAKMREDGPMTYTLILLRHGESEWNAKNLFTGWVDVPLNEKGWGEAERGGELLKAEDVLPDVVHTSLLRRAIMTANLALDSADRHWIPVKRNWRLNERHYGDLQGKNKAETLEQFGEEKFMIWRRSYDVPPPVISDDNEYTQEGDPRYAGEPIPKTECLKDVLERALPYWESAIVPDLKDGKTVMVAAHGNSLRAIIKYLDGVS